MFETWKVVAKKSYNYEKNGVHKEGYLIWYTRQCYDVWNERGFENNIFICEKPQMINKSDYELISLGDEVSAHFEIVGRSVKFLGIEW